MRYEEVRRAFGRRPFAPLVVRMVSGVEYSVRTPESIVSPRYAAFLLDDGTIETGALEYIEAFRPAPKPARRSGRRGRN